MIMRTYHSYKSYLALPLAVQHARDPDMMRCDVTVQEVKARFCILFKKRGKDDNLLNCRSCFNKDESHCDTF